MYNKYMPNADETFSELYRPVEYERDSKESMSVCERERDVRSSKSRFDLKKLLHGLDVDKMGIIPLVLLLLLLVDVDDEEKLIIIVLAVIFGI